MLLLCKIVNIFKSAAAAFLSNICKLYKLRVDFDIASINITKT